MRPIKAGNPLKSKGRTALSLLYVAIGLLFSGLAFGQGSIAAGHPVVTNGLGQPVPGASVAVCASNPGVAPTSVCTNLATTFTDITDSVACSGTSKPLNNQANPTVGGSCSNPGFTDGRGNVVVFAAASTYWCEFYGRGIVGISVVPCIFPGVGGGSTGGTNVQINGTAQATANFNSLAPPVDTGFTAATYKTNGTGVIAEVPKWDPTEFCLIGTGLGSQFNIGFQSSVDPCATPAIEIIQGANGGMGLFGPVTVFNTLFAGAVDVTTGPLYSDVVNCASSPTVTNKLAVFNGGCTQIATSFFTSGILGITGNSGGASFGAQIAIGGHIPCIFDGATTANDFVVNGTAGACHDSGILSTSGSFPSTQVVGIVTSTNASAGTYLVYIASANGGSGGGGGGGSVNPASQFAAPYYSGAGVSTTISGASPPAINGQYYNMYTVTASTPVAPAPTQVGLSSRAVTGTTSTDTILYSDNASNVDYQGSVSVAVSLPTATTLGNSQLITVLNNNTTGSSTTVTVTPVTWTINAASTLVIAQGQSCKIKVDAAGGKWDAECTEGQLTAGANVTFTRNAFGMTVAATGGGGGSGAWSAITNPIAGLTLNHSTFSTEFDWTLPGIATGAFLLKGNDSTGADTSFISAADTVAGSHQSPFRVGITGVNQFQVCWQAGPQGEVVIGSTVACSGINQTQFAKSLTMSSVAGHTLHREWQSNSGANSDFNEWNTATAAGTGFYFLKGFTGVTSTDTSSGGGTNIFSIRGDGLYTGSGSLSALTLTGITGSTQCLTVNSSGVVSGTGSACGAGGGSGTISAALQYSFAYYSAAGSAQTISGISAPTTPNGVPQVLTTTPSGGAATAPALSLPGLAGRAITGTTATDTILATDCNPKRVEYVGSVAVAIALPTATTLAVPNCTFRATNNTTGSTTALTITPATWTINGAATLTVSQGQIATIYVDPNSATNWVADVTEQKIVAGSNITLTRSATSTTVAGQPGTVTSIATTAPIAGGTITGSGTLTCPTCVTSAASLTSNAVVTGGGGQASATISADTTTTHALFATAGAPAFRAVVSGDIPTLNQNTTGTAANLSGTPALPNGTTATTQAAKSNDTKLATDAYVDAPTPLTAGASVSLSAPRQYFVCTTTCTITVPVPAAGYEFCVMNDDNVATVITLSAIGSSARYENTARTAYGTAGTGTFISGGAVGDKVCILGRDATHYLTASFNGTWTAN